MRKATAVVVAGAVLAVAGVTLLGFDVAIYDHEVRPITDASSNGASDETPREFEDLSPEARDAFLGALEVARESESRYATYTVTGSDERPPEFIYVNDASASYLISYRGDLYELYTNRGGPGLGSGVMRVFLGAAATLIGLAALVAGRYVSANPRILRSATFGVGGVVALVWFNAGLPGYHSTHVAVGARILTFAALFGLFWLALGIRRSSEGTDPNV